MYVCVCVCLPACLSVCLLAVCMCVRVYVLIYIYPSVWLAADDTCVGHKNMILPHPYTCHKYISCNYGILKVERCPEKKCFHRLQLSCY